MDRAENRLPLSSARVVEGITPNCIHAQQLGSKGAGVTLIKWACIHTYYRKKNNKKLLRKNADGAPGLCFF